MSDDQSLALYFQQNDSALRGYIDHLTGLRRAIDKADAQQIAFHLEMLLGLYHLLEGNHINIKNLIGRENPAFKFLDEAKPN